MEQYTNEQLYKAKADFLGQALTLNQNLTMINAEIGKREAKVLKEMNVTSEVTSTSTVVNENE